MGLKSVSSLVPHQRGAHRNKGTGKKKLLKIIMTQAPYESSVPHDVSRNSKAHPADTPLSAQISDRIEKNKDLLEKSCLQFCTSHISSK